MWLVGGSRKARRKERDGEPAGDPKLYLQEALLERKLPDLDMRRLVDLPDGLDYNEWLASHSEYPCLSRLFTSGADGGTVILIAHMLLTFQRWRCSTT